MSLSSDTSRRFYLAFQRWATLSVAQPGRQQAHTRQSKRHYHLHTRRPHQARSNPLNQCPVRYQSQDAVVASSDPVDSSESNIVSGLEGRSWRSPIAPRTRRWSLSQTGDILEVADGDHTSTEVQDHISGGLRSYRSTLSALASPVVVLTTWDVEAARADPDGTKMEDRWHGVTLGSFTSLCLDPRPHITFNIRVGSRTLAALRRQRTPRVCIHILNANSEAAEVASTFAKPYERSEEPFEALSQKGVTIGLQQGVPFLQWRKMTKAWLFCSFEGDCVVKTVGDHHICVFRVDMMDKATTSNKTLNYCRGEYVKTFSLDTVIESDARKPKSKLEAATDGNTIAARGIETEARVAASKTSSRKARARRSKAKPTSVEEISLSAATNPPSVDRETTNTPTAEAKAALPTTRRVPSTVVRKTLPRDGDSNVIARRSVMSVRSPRNPPRVREYSTTQDTDQSTNMDDGDIDPNVGLNPAMAKETAGDFLCHNTERYPKRFKRLIKFNEESKEWQARLAMKANASGVEEHEKLGVESFIAGRNRFVARQLALHAAYDLEYMLDHAHVSPSRVQYIESCIERGQAALIEEGRKLMQRMSVHGPLIETKFENRSRLLQEEEKLRTVLHRLHDYAEDDEQNSFYDD